MVSSSSQSRRTGEWPRSLLPLDSCLGGGFVRFQTLSFPFAPDSKYSYRRKSTPRTTLDERRAADHCETFVVKGALGSGMRENHTGRVETWG